MSTKSMHAQLTRVNSSSALLAKSRSDNDASDGKQCCFDVMDLRAHEMVLCSTAMGLAAFGKTVMLPS